MLEHAYDKLARNYDDLYSEPTDLKEDEELFALIKTFQKGKTLDIGAGTGLLLDNIDIPVEQYFGIDPSREMLAKLDKKHPNRKIMEATAEYFYGLIGDFDTVLALYGTASYIDLNHLHNIKNMLSKDGKLFLMFYKPKYYPRFYKNKHKKKLDANRNYAVIHREFDHVYDWANYVIATNFVIDEWEASKYK